MIWFVYIEFYIVVSLYLSFHLSSSDNAFFSLFLKLNFRCVPWLIDQGFFALKKCVCHQSQVNRCMYYHGWFNSLPLDWIQFMPTQSDYNRDAYSIFFFCCCCCCCSNKLNAMTAKCPNKFNALDASNINTYLLVDRRFGYLITRTCPTWWNTIRQSRQQFEVAMTSSITHSMDAHSQRNGIGDNLFRQSSDFLSSFS